MNARRGITQLCYLLLGLAVAGTALARTSTTPYTFDDSGYLGDASLMPDWSDTLARQRAQSVNLALCAGSPDSIAEPATAEKCRKLYRGVRVMLEKARALAPDQQIRLVNYYVNRKRYRNDRTRTMTTDLTAEPVRYRSRWSTVEEFLTRGGDCEDYATTKYFLLRELGFEPSQLRIAVVWDREARGHHALLAVRREDKIQLLDSDNRIRPTGRRHPYRFIYSVNEHSVWDHEDKPRASRTVSANLEKSA